MKTAKSLTWLHLSDWHQKTTYDQQIVAAALFEDIRHRAEVSPELEKIDFVVFSGDLTFSGQSHEFERAHSNFLEPLLDACGVASDRLFIVPGNHDVDRSDIEILNEDLPAKLHQPDELAQVLLTQTKRQTVLSPLSNYEEFLRKKDRFGANRCSYYGFRVDLDIHEVSVVLLGINSAWLCGYVKDRAGEVNDYGELIVGEPQLTELLKNSVDDSDLVIAIMHHPLEWLSDRPTCRDRLRTRRILAKHCHFILHGHEHQPSVMQHLSNYGSYIVIPAGAAYDRRDYPNGYNFCRVDLGKRMVKVYLRQFAEGGWFADLDTAGGEGNEGTRISVAQ